MSPDPTEQPFPSPTDDSGGPDPDAQRFRIAGAVRRLTTLVVSAPFDDGELAGVADDAEELADRLAGLAGPGRRAREVPDPERMHRHFFPTSPIIGRLNPIAPPLTMRRVEPSEPGGVPEVEATGSFDYPYEGPPTCVHGGIIAELFDEVLGSANIVAGMPGMTVNLTVNYRRPTPLRTELRVVGRCLGADGRKINTWGGIFDGDTLTAEATGIFVAVPPDKMLSIVEGNAAHADPAVLSAIRAESQRRANEN